MEDATCTLDGFGPMPIVRPESVAQIGDQVRDASARGEALYPFGGRTEITLGNPPSSPGRAVEMRRLASVVDFPARDMTITVQAGIPVKSLQDLLAKERLRLPIDVPHAERATLGGILATNCSGARRLGYGTLRDYVIGISAVNDDGDEFKAGGRVVKNVAGYDLCKLLVGSLGTLGIITQATLKLRPLAEQQALLSLACESANLESILAALHDSQTRPVCIELLNQPAARLVLAHSRLPVPDSPWVIVVGYEGNADAVGWQVQQLVKEVGAQCRLQAWVDFPAGPLWEALTEFAHYGALAFKANLLSSKVSAFCLAVDREPNRPTLRAHAGNGIVFGQWQDDLTIRQVGNMLNDWRNRATQGDGRVVVPRCPSAWKSAIDVWGPPSADVWLMREIKKQFDPRRIFNPGRFVDGI